MSTMSGRVIQKYCSRLASPHFYLFVNHKQRIINSTKNRVIANPLDSMGLQFPLTEYKVGENTIASSHQKTMFFL